MQQVPFVYLFCYGLSEAFNLLDKLIITCPMVYREEDAVDTKMYSAGDFLKIGAVKL